MKREPHRLSWRDLLAVLLLGLAIWGLWAYSRYIQGDGGLQYQWSWQRILRFFAYRTSEGHAEGWVSWRAGPMLQGLVSTIKLSFYSIVFALLLGLVAGILQVQKLRLLRLFGQFYVELIRNIPPLVVVMTFYFFFASPLVEVLGLESLSRNASPHVRSWLGFFVDMGSGQNNLILGNFFAAVLILGIYEGAYIAEIVRAGMQAIPLGQQNAAFSLGLSGYQTYTSVLLPQMFRLQLPALTNQFVSAIKDSAIVSLISIQELTFRSKQVITTTRAFVESSIAMLLLYLLLTGLCSYLASRLVRQYQIR